MHRKKINLFANSRGFSSIIGAIFAVLIMFSLVSTVFVWTLSKNAAYENTMAQNRQADLDRSNEKIVANVTCSRVNGSTVSVSGTLQNVGSLSAQIVTLWVVNNNTQKYASMSPLSISPLKPGGVTILSGSTAINVTLTNSPGDILSCWFISARGNTISKNPLFGLVTGGNSYTYANVSQGIGLIGFDFKQFSHFDFSTQPSGNNVSLGVFQKTYTISISNYTVFHVLLTNFDPANATLTIDQNSSIYTITTQGNAVKYGKWSLVNVTGDATNGYYLNPTSSTSYTLPATAPVDVFFAGSPGSSASLATGVYPMNIMVFGKLGTNDYGQNVPFVALNILT